MAFGYKDELLSELRITVEGSNTVQNIAMIYLICLTSNYYFLAYESRTARQLVINDEIEFTSILVRQIEAFLDLWKRHEIQAFCSWDITYAIDTQQLSKC